LRGLLIGRFQPFHKGHLAVVVEIRNRNPSADLLLGVGSAQASHTSENPFTAGERVEMIELALAEARVDHVTAYPIPDVDRHAVWVAHVESLVPQFERVYTNNPLTRLLFERARYEVVSPELVRRDVYEGRRIRAAMASGEPWKESVPPAVARCIDSWGGVDRMRLVSELESQRRRSSLG
jgi:nicotinamide-nucleotide adenylyltransferase